MRVLSLADSETLVLTNYHDDAIKELSLGSTADITADAVPIDEARAVIYAETAPTRTKYLWITDTATGLSLSYIVAQINNKGDNLYEIIAYTAIYLLDAIKLPAKYYNNVSIQTALEDVKTDGVSFYCDSLIAEKSITGYCQEQTARERLQQFCWGVGGYVSCADWGLVKVLSISESTTATFAKSDIYEFPTITNDDEVSKINLSVHTYTAGGGGGDTVKDGDGNTYSHTVEIISKTNTSATGVLGKELNIETATLINSTNAQETLNRCALLFFNSATWDGQTVFKNVTPGERVIVQDRQGRNYKGYVYGAQYIFGKGMGISLTIKQTAVGIELDAPTNLKLRADYYPPTPADRGYYELMWDTVANADKYVVEKNTGKGWQTLGTSLVNWKAVIAPLDEYVPTIKYRVQAIDTTGNYGDSPYSAAFTVNYHKVTRNLKNVSCYNKQLSIPDGYSFWDEVYPTGSNRIYAAQWDLHVGGADKKSTGTISADNDKLEIDCPNVTGDVLLSVNASLSPLEALPTPTPTITGNVIMWEAITGASSYMMMTGGGLVKSVMGHSYDLELWSELPTGTNYINVKAVSGVSTATDSLWSAAVAWTKKGKLPTPVATVYGDKLSWNKIAGAGEYVITYKNTATGETAGTYNLSSLYATTTITISAVGNYTATVKAIADPDYGYADSDESAAVPFIVTGSKLATPTATWTERTSTLSWNSIAGANGYKVTVKYNAAAYYEYYAQGTTQQIDTSKLTDIGSYYAEVKALAAPSPFDSSASNPVLVYQKAQSKLKTPVITLSGTTISWSKIPNNSGYQLNITSSAGALTPLTFSNTELTEYNLARLGFTSGTYTITLTAKGTDDGDYADSDPSNAVIYDASAGGKLPAPTNVKTGGNTVEGEVGTLTWDGVAHNSGYKINADIVSATSTMNINWRVGTDVTKTDLEQFDVGTWLITVKALGTGSYTDSDESDPVTYIVTSA